MLLRTYLQTHNAIARRTFTDLIDQGKIFLNGKKIDSYKQEIQEGDKLQIADKKEIIHINKKKSEVVLFNKPMGYVASKADPHNTTIYTILPKELQSYYYIGRLDKESHGLLLLTNDPALVHEFEHPTQEIEKEYIVKLDKPVKNTDIKHMVTGVKEGKDTLKAKKITKIDETTLDIILTEGKNRHIRRMCKVLGYEVIDLQRIREGKYELGKIKLGEGKLAESK